MTGPVFLTLGISAVAAIPLAAATLEVTPSTITHFPPGVISISVSGVASAESVVLEKFVDLDGNGTIDAGDPLIQRLSLRDGHYPEIAGIRNVNVPGDEDGQTNGALIVRHQLSEGSDLNRFAGNYKFRLSSPGGKFSPVERSFSIVPPAYGQSIRGTVFREGEPLGYSLVAVISATPDQPFLGGAIANASGQYFIAAPSGRYRLLAFKPGNASVGQLTAPLRLSAGQQRELNLTNLATSRTISGALLVEGTSLSLPAVQFFISSPEGHATVGFTDAQGHFQIPVSISEWAMTWSAASLRQLGVLGPAYTSFFDTTFGDANTSISLPAVQSLITGTLQTQSGLPIAGGTVRAQDTESFTFAGTGVSETNGTYVIGVRGGSDWEVAPEKERLARLGYICLPAAATLSSNEVVSVNLDPRTIDAHVMGRVVRSDGVALSDIEIEASNFEGNSSWAVTDASGDFDLGVVGGYWNLYLQMPQETAHSLLPPSFFPIDVFSGMETNLPPLVVQQVTATIQGTIRDTNGIPMAFIPISGFAEADGLEYRVFGQTDDQGRYLLPAFTGTWTVALESLIQQGMEAPPPGTIGVDAPTNTLDFLVHPVEPLHILSANPIVGYSGQPFWFPLEAGGGSRPYSWTLVSGELSGLNLEMDGILSGTPSGSGTNTFVVQLMDNAGTSITQPFSFVAVFPVSLQISNTPGSQLVICLAGKPGQKYVLESAFEPRPANWIPLATNASPQGVLLFTNSPAIMGSTRFFRAREH